MTNLTKLAGVLLAVLVVATGAAAALPGNAPADSHAGQASDHPDDATADEERADDESDAEDESDGDAETDRDRESAQRSEQAQAQGAEQAERPDHAGERGPPTDMPAQVPDFVSELHQLINDWLGGDRSEPLGPQVSDVTPGEESSEGDSQSTTTGANSTTENASAANATAA